MHRHLLTIGDLRGDDTMNDTRFDRVWWPCEALPVVGTKRRRDCSAKVIDDLLDRDWSPVLPSRGRWYGPLRSGVAAVPRMDHWDIFGPSC